MSQSNDKTLQSYEQHLRAYIDGTPQDVEGIQKQWMDQAVSGLAVDARILEIGSAFGRDAAYFNALGYQVDCTDAAQVFVDYLNDNGFTARPLNILSDDLAPSAHDLVYANAVLLHIERKDIDAVLSKILKALKPRGVFAFSLKLGEGEEWTQDKLGAPRYFCYWQPDTIRERLEKAGFIVGSIEIDTGYSHQGRIRIIARKEAA